MSIEVILKEHVEHLGDHLAERLQLGMRARSRDELVAQLADFVLEQVVQRLEQQAGGLEFLAQGFANLAQIGRPDFFAGLNNEFGIEAEPAAARLANRPQRRPIDAVLPFIVGSAAAVDAIT